MTALRPMIALYQPLGRRRSVKAADQAALR